MEKRFVTNVLETSQRHLQECEIKSKDYTPYTPSKKKWRS